MKRPANSLAWKLTLWFLLLSFLPIGVMAVFVRHSVAATFVDVTSRSVRTQAAFLAAQVPLMQDERHIQRLLGSASGEDYVAFLFDRTGAYVAHSNHDEMAGSIDNEYLVTIAANIPVGETGVVTDESSGQVVAYAKVPGDDLIAAVATDRAFVYTPLQRMERDALIQLAVSMFIISIIGGMAIWIVIEPIQQLARAAGAIGAGDLDVQLDPSDMEGELELLTVAFNGMARQLRESYALLEKQVTDRTKELAALNTVTAAVSHSLNLDEILNDALDTTLQVLEIEAGGIYLLDDEAQELVLTTHRGFTPAFIKEVDRLKVGEGFSGRVIQSATPLVVPDISQDQRLTRTVAREEGLHSLASVPVCSKQKVLGTLFTVTRDVREFTEQEVQLLVSIGHQIGIAVENARLYEQAQQLAVLEERQRLARDLHDSVTQALYGMTLYAEAAARQLSLEHVDKACEYVHELGETSQEALAEMRLLIHKLRPPVLQEEGLVAALQARLQSVEGRVGLSTDLKVRGDGQLPLNIEEGLYRIAQEALNNALKHGHAHSIMVSLCWNDRAVTLEIVDDGVGFEPQTARMQGGVGLSAMNERTAKLGGTLSITSALGEGTLVRVEVLL